MSRLSFIALVFVFMTAVSEGTVASAQSSGTLVQFGAHPGVESIEGAAGATVNVPVSIMGTAGMMPRVDADISVPAPLRVLDTSYCSAETAPAAQESVFEFEVCQIVGQISPVESQLISAEIDGLRPFEVFRINATLVMEIPSNAAVGSEYTIRALNYDFVREPSRITIAVTEHSAATKVPPAASPTRDIRPAGPLHDIDGSELDFSVGSIRPFSFEINYDAYPEATSASLTLYASTGIIDVADSSVIDLDAVHACDSSGAVTSQSFQKPKRSFAALPAFFNLSLPRWMEPGAAFQVCAEVVYYNGTQILGVERYMSVITVRE